MTTEVPFSAIVTPQSVSFTAVDGKVYNIDSSHREWSGIIDTIKELQKALKLDPADPDKVAALRLVLLDLVDVSQKINSAGAGKVTVRDGVVYYADEPVHSAITERILWGLTEGFDMTAYMAFLDNAMDNPSNRSVTEMYSFMERYNMGITEDGYILGYKKVREDFKDIYSGKFDNSPGQIVEMRRNQVNDDARQTCSHGLHFCAMSYLSQYGTSRGNKIVIVKVNPADIVSVPVDYGFAKVRCCKYEVLAEYTGPDVEDLLGSKAVWTSEDSFEWNSESDDYDDDYGSSDYDDDLEDDSNDEYDYCDNCGEDTPDCICGQEDEDAIEAEVEHEVDEIIAEFEDLVADADLAADLVHESGPVTLTDEGADMRAILDAVEHPVSQDTAEMRSYIEAVEHPDSSKAGPVEYPTKPGVDEMKKFIDAVKNPDPNILSPTEHVTAVIKNLAAAVDDPSTASAGLIGSVDKSETVKVVNKDGSLDIDALRRLSEILKGAVDQKGNE